MRCFVAVPIPPEVLARVGEVQRALRKACGGADVRWAAPDTLHVTLKFLGHVRPEQLEPVREMVAAEAARHRAARVTLAGVGAFPTARRVRVVWLGVAAEGPFLVELASAMDRGAAALGFEEESRPFAPHVTLGRVRSPHGGADLSRQLGAVAGAEAGSWTPAAIVLYESLLRPAGAVHVPRAECPLG